MIESNINNATKEGPPSSTEKGEDGGEIDKFESMSFDELLVVAKGLKKENQELREDLEEANEKIEHNYFDPLISELLNKGAIEKKVIPSLRRSFYEDENADWTVLFGDMNDFKPINDTHGHQVGDRALQKVGEIVADSIRPGDFAIRWGGDEFVLVLRADVDEAKLVAERIKNKLSEATIDETDAPLSMSIGYAPVEDLDEFNSAIFEADKMALENKKENGGGR